MTSKKRRQRGPCTRSGGTHKNRRDAGHRGDRGRAGCDKHESHNYEPLGKHGFKRPDVLQDDIAEVKVQKLDEDAALLAADGVAEEDDGTYATDARDVTEDGREAGVAKALGGRQVHNELHVVADVFTAGAVELIEEAGGDAELPERAGEVAEAEESTDADEGDEE